MAEDVIIEPLCLTCERTRGFEGSSCLAFPLGIPEEILNGEFDHHNPHSDDNGIQFLED